MICVRDEDKQKVHENQWFCVCLERWFKSPRKWAFDLIKLIKCGNFFEFMRWRGKLLQFYVNMSLWLIEWIVECIKLVSLHGFMRKMMTHYATCGCYCILEFKNLNDFPYTLRVAINFHLKRRLKSNLNQSNCIQSQWERVKNWAMKWTKSDGVIKSLSRIFLITFFLFNQKLNHSITFSRKCIQCSSNECTWYMHFI